MQYGPREISHAATCRTVRLVRRIERGLLHGEDLQHGVLSLRFCPSTAQCNLLTNEFHCCLSDAVLPQVVPSFFAMSSCHLLLSRPLDLFPLLGCHCCLSHAVLLQVVPSFFAVSSGHLLLGSGTGTSHDHLDWPRLSYREQFKKRVHWYDTNCSGTGTSHDHLDWPRLSYREQFKEEDEETDSRNDGKTTSKSGPALNGTSCYGKLRTARSGGSWL